MGDPFLAYPLGVVCQDLQHRKREVRLAVEACEVVVEPVQAEKVIIQLGETLSELVHRGSFQNSLLSDYFRKRNEREQPRHSLHTAYRREPWEEVRMSRPSS